MTKRLFQSLYLALFYLISLSIFIMFISIAGNEYAWMHDEDSSIVLPVDPDINMKSALFGAPLIIMLAVTTYYSFIRFGNILKSISLIYSAVLLLLSVFHFFHHSS